jgi:aminoglycoside phosphotransferase (APT) family kinase protein
MTGAATTSAALRSSLRETLGGGSVRVVSRERLKPHVDRLRLHVDGAPRAIVVKRSSAEAARRNRLVARRWLPAVALDDLGPPLLGVVADRDGEHAWQVQEDLRGRPLSSTRSPRAHVRAAVEAIARVHTALADHPLLAECRLWGGDRGVPFYTGNVRDAVRALGAPGLDRIAADVAAPRDALLARLARLADEEPRRARIAAACAEPETLVHGDLWPSNAIVMGEADTIRVRFVDWDEAAVAPPSFDLATLLLRFARPERRAVLGAYRDAVRRVAGRELPAERELVVLLETAAYARLASMLVWTVAAAAEGDEGWLPERLREVVRWLDDVDPVLPPR